MNLIDEECPYCKNKQTDIVCALNIGTDISSENMYYCLDCKKDHTRIRTEEEQKRTQGFIKTDKEVIEYSKQQAQHVFEENTSDDPRL